MVQRVFGYVEIPADDPVAATKFYEKAFGWGNAIAMGEDYSYMHSGNLAVGFPRINGESRHKDQVILYVDTPDIEADLVRNDELGGTTLIGKTPIDDTSWYAWLKDTTGNTLGIFEQATPPDIEKAKQMQSGRPFVHVEIPVKDRKTDADYFANLFGWNIQHMDEMHYSFFMPSEDSFGGGFEQISDKVKPGDVVAYLHSDDLKADGKIIEAAGGTLEGDILEVPNYGAQLYWRDPSGNRLALWQSFSKE